MAPARGAFIVFEGIDRCGKSTQSLKLVEHLQRNNTPVELWRFPDRTCSATGATINAYLAKEVDLCDEAVHLLFSANRWEKRAELERKLAMGVTLVVDRYAFSGVAYSAAKRNPRMTYEWCRACDTGLPAPDRVIYMQMPPEASARRGGYGGERYEKLAFQQVVAGMFERLKDASWRSFDAEQAIDDIHQQVVADVDAVVGAVAAGARPLQHLWDATPLAPVPSAPARADDAVLKAGILPPSAAAAVVDQEHDETGPVKDQAAH